MSKFSAEKTYALFDALANKKLIREISAIGAKTILFSNLEIAEINETEIADLPSTLKNFDWLIFPDIYTVEFFLRVMENADFDLFELDNLRVCAFGESVADRLRFAQLHADVISNSVKTIDVWESLKNYLFDEDEFRNLRFLIFKEKDLTIEIAGYLKQQNYAVKELAIYQTISNENAETAKLKTLLRGGAVDEFIFTSPFDVLNLAHLFPNENLADVLEDVTLFPADNQAKQTLEEFRLL